MDTNTRKQLCGQLGLDHYTTGYLITISGVGVDDKPTVCDRAVLPTGQTAFARVAVGQKWLADHYGRAKWKADLSAHCF